MAKLTPLEKYDARMKFLRNLVWFCGADILDPNYKINWLTIVVFMCIALVFGFSFYTAYLKASESWLNILEVFCMIGSVAQGLSKLVCAIKLRFELQDLDQSIRNVYEEKYKQGQEYRTVLEENAEFCEKGVKLVAIVFTAMCLTFLSFPLLAPVIMGKKIFIMQFLIPGIDPETFYGYIVTLCFHMLCFFFGAFGNYGADMFFLVGVMHANLYVNILKTMLNNLKGDNIKIVFEAKKDNTKIKNTLVEVLKWHQEYCKYITTLDTFFFWTIFVEIFTIAFSIMATLFVCLVGSDSFLSGYPYLIYCVGFLFMYCSLGTVVEIKNDEVVNAIYETDWYLLSRSDQKMLGLMLLKAQNPVLLTVGGFIPLSVSTGLQVMKTVYSYTMILLNFVE